MIQPCPPWRRPRAWRILIRSAVALGVVLTPLSLAPQRTAPAGAAPPGPLTTASPPHLSPATGGEALSLDDSFAPGGDGVPVLLTGPVYEEQAPGDLGAGRLTLQLPPGFAFDPAAVVTVTASAAAGASCPPNSPTATQINFSQVAVATMTNTTAHVNISRASSGADRCKLTWTGLRILQTGVVPTAGALTAAPGGALIAGVQSGVTSWGSLASLPGRHDHFVYAAQPGGGTGGLPWTAQPAVESRDRFDNLRTHDAASRTTLTIVPGSGAANAALSCAGGTSVPLAAGVARFSGCAIDRAGRGYVLRAATDAPLHGAGTTGRDSTPFDISIGPAAKLAFVTQPGGGPAGAVWEQQPVVAIQDAGGNLRAGDALTVGLALGTNPSGGTLTCAAPGVSTVEGRARFSGCAITRAGTGYTLRATSGALTPADSVPFAISGDPPALLEVAVQPAGATGGTPFATQPSVRLTDLTGALLTSDATTQITADLLSPNASGGVLSGVRTVTAAAGVAQFIDLAVDVAGSGYRLRFTASNGAPAVTSAPFDVGVGPPASIRAVSGDLQEATTGVTLAAPLVAAVTDRGGNPVPGAAAAWAVTQAPGPGAGVTADAAALTTDAQGRVQVTLTLGAASGIYAVTVTCTLCPPGNRTATFAATALPPPSIAAVVPSARGQGAGPAELVVSGAGFRPGTTVQVEGDGVTVHSIAVDSAERLRAVVSVAPTAAIGPRTLTVTTTDGGAAALAGSFTVTPAPAARSVQPAIVRPSAASQTLMVTGAGFVEGATVAMVGPGAPLAVPSVAVTSPTTLTAVLAAFAEAAPGVRSLTITNPDGGTSTSAPLLALPGLLADPVLTVSSLSPGITTTAVLSFTTAQAIPAAGALSLAFPADAGLAAAGLASLSIAGAPCPAAAARVTGATMIVTPLGCSVPAGSRVSLTLASVVAPGSGAYQVAVQSLDSSGLLLDEGTAAAQQAVAPTPTPTATPTITPTATRTPAATGGGGGGGGSASAVTPTPTVRPRPTVTPVPALPGAEPPAPAVEPVSATVAVTREERVQAGGVRIEFPARAAGSSGMMTVTVDPLPVTGGGTLEATIQAAVRSGAPLPEGLVAGTLAFRMELRDGAGRRITQFAKPVTLTVTYGREDLRLAGGVAAGVLLYRYDEHEEAWRPLPDQRSAADDAPVVVGETLQPGIFALVVEVPRPALTGPMEGAVAADLAPVLTWMPAATTRWHQVQVVPFNNDGPAINLIVGEPAAVASGRFAVPPPVFGEGPYLLLPGMSYVWRVRLSTSLLPMLEASAGWSVWQTSTFRTGAPTSATILLRQPPQDSTTASLTPVLMWTNQNPRIFYYEVQLSRDPTFETDPGRATAAVYWNLVHGGVTDPPNSFTVPPDAPLDTGAVYYWRVRPRVQGDGFPVDWTPAGRFRTP